MQYTVDVYVYALHDTLASMPLSYWDKVRQCDIAEKPHLLPPRGASSTQNMADNS